MASEAGTETTASTQLLPGPGGGHVEPGDRGETLIRDRVVERIVTAATDEVGATAGTTRRVLGIPLGHSDRPEAKAQVYGDVVTAAVSLAVRYPSPVREVAAEVRQHVMDRVEELTGLRVSEVDVSVVSLVPDLQPRVR